jgi:hypothetical protein
VARKRPVSGTVSAALPTLLKHVSGNFKEPPKDQISPSVS